ncbi:hypothetical protein L6452_16640 [Arctium lappa]|uniref:Uncharacterized protein n=1 Tax=Arctium lappa TaxID=4217 RepID=A0ACB9C1C5_ARCLA|nr:hypothetical protein L6452_16640 [Arctium lappa]
MFLVRKDGGSLGVPPTVWYERGLGLFLIHSWKNGKDVRGYGVLGDKVCPFPISFLLFISSKDRVNGLECTSRRELPFLVIVSFAKIKSDLISTKIVGGSPEIRDFGGCDISDFSESDFGGFDNVYNSFVVGDMEFGGEGCDIFNGSIGGIHDVRSGEADGRAERFREATRVWMSAE